MNYYTDVLKKYAVFNGRATRKEYWMFFLFNIIASIIVSIIDNTLNIGFLAMLYSLAVIIPSIAVAARRLHDTGRSGWWLLICLVPFIGVIVFIVFAVQDSQPNENKYGPSPKVPNVQ